MYLSVKCLKKSVDLENQARFLSRYQFKLYFIYFTNRFSDHKREHQGGFSQNRDRDSRGDPRGDRGDRGYGGHKHDRFSDRPRDRPDHRGDHRHRDDRNRHGYHGDRDRDRKRKGDDHDRSHDRRGAKDPRYSNPDHGSSGGGGGGSNRPPPMSSPGQQNLGQTDKHL